MTLIKITPLTASAGRLLWPRNLPWKELGGGGRALTNVLGGNLVKVMAWYDNEMGFSRRMLDLAAYIGQRLG
ncbi:MAG: hypothetical protein ACYDIC_07590 [Desulfobaccales bacterium]